MATTKVKGKQVTYKAPGAGSVTRNLFDKLSELPTRADFATEQDYLNAVSSVEKLGAEAVSYVPEGTGAVATAVEDILDAQLMVDYVALRAYTGLAKTVRITGLLTTAQPRGIAGFFQYDETDVTSADNGGTIIVGSDGRRWKRVYTGAIQVSWFEGANFSTKLTNAMVAIPATGGVLDATDLTGSQTIASTITISKPITLWLGAAKFEMGSSQIFLRASGIAIYGVGRIDENNGPTQFVYRGTADAIVLQRSAPALPLFGIRLRDFEVTGLDAAQTAATAFGISAYGTRYCEYHNILVFNLQQGVAFYFTGNGAVVDGFGATNQIFNPGVSTCRIGIRADAGGGSQSTHGMVYGGFLFGSTSGFESSCESWRLHDTDLGGAASVNLTGAADDTALVACRWEASVSEVVIGAGVSRVQIVAPSIINHQGSGPTITDNGTGTLVISTHPTTDSKLLGLRAASNYANKGVTGTLAVGAAEDVLNMGSGGVWLVSVRQADGGTAWRAAGIVWSSGLALAVSQFAGGSNVTISSSGALLRLVNSSATDPQALAWSVLKIEGAPQF